MKHQYVIVLFALIITSSMVSFTSYRATEREVNEDMSQALALALDEQQSDVISADTIQIFNRYLQIEALRGNALLAVDTRQGFRPRPQCSMATIFALSDQRPAMVLWMMTTLWGLFCLWKRRKQVPIICGYGGLVYSETDRRFFGLKGEQVKLTPMQQQLLEMFYVSPSHLLTKKEICDALWPKKEDASETLYTLIRRLKPIVEQHSNLRITSDRGRAYELKDR
ncbi:MAG: helix-turn-helix domain-containing protein [Prevotella sp.]|nr:helix-turn-helix domain-containing protein [Prevotella sp.]